MQDTLDVDPLIADKIPINETSSCSAIQKCLDRVDLTSVYGTELNGQD